jgi:hypothetical protein
LLTFAFSARSADCRLSSTTIFGSFHQLPIFKLVHVSMVEVAMTLS